MGTHHPVLSPRGEAGSFACAAFLCPVVGRLEHRRLVNIRRLHRLRVDGAQYHVPRIGGQDVVQRRVDICALRRLD